MSKSILKQRCRGGILAVLLLGCAAHDDMEHADAGEPTGSACPTTQTLRYSNFGQAFMATYCLRCHSSSVVGPDRNGAPGDHNFDLLDDIRSLADHIDAHAGAGPNATNTLMPKSEPRPSLEERARLSEWLACAAPE